jgi:hypothetical protein
MSVRSNILQKILSGINDKKGTVLIVVMGAVLLMGLTTIFLANIVTQNGALIHRVKYASQASFLAEAGIARAVARFKSESFASRTAFSGTLSTGKYDVTFSESGGRHLITSTGTANNVSKTVSVEVEDRMSSAWDNILSAGNNIRVNSFIANATINGDIHANNDVYLKSGFLVASLNVTGKVSATGIVKEGTRYDRRDGFWGGYADAHVYVNGLNDDQALVYESEDRVIFPAFNYEKYREAADDSGDLYTGDQVFNDRTFSPSGGIVYVDGDVEFNGNNTINGGIIADDITVWGSLTQKSTTNNRNVIISRSGDIAISGKFNIQEAGVYAGRDIFSLSLGADININGVMMARRDIYMWNFLTIINYVHKKTYPQDVGNEDDQKFGIVSWNR